jgi:hypothetical protein
MKIRILQQRWFERTLRTRLPFKYGIATMTEVPHVWLELTAEIDGQVVRGWAADHLPPKWFTKDPDRGIEGEITDMRAVLRMAGLHAVDGRGATVGRVAQEIGEAQRMWAVEVGHPPLLANFGVSFLERALIDAWCRRFELSLHAALAGNSIGLDLGGWHAELAGTVPAAGLPVAPLKTAWARHTVGLGDPLEESDVEEGGRPADALPVSLAAAIRRYGLRHFKLKVAAGTAGAEERLARTVAVIRRETQGEFSASLDGNETFGGVAQLRDEWSRWQALGELKELWPRLLFVEQPIARSGALADEVGRDLQAWRDRPPLLIDESGAGPEDTHRALELGYAGVSHKNCKGVLQGVANACLLAQRRRQLPTGTWLMSGEDLANVGPIALPQDLASQAALGNGSIERNGHHYFAGLQAWPKATQDYALNLFGDLYERTEAGWPTVRIGAGRLALEGVGQDAFGARGGPVMAEAGELWCEL